MESIQWDDSYSVGVDLIDEQHQELIQRLSDVCLAVESFQGPTEISKTLDFLSDYTDHHFSTEERHMDETSYSKFDEHLSLHKEFKDTLKKINQDFYEEGATENLAKDIKTLLGNWFIDHIQKVDKEFGAFLIENNIDIVE